MTKKILMFGCGRWPDESHLPAIAKDPDIKLAYVVELESNQEEVKQRLKKHGLNPKLILVNPETALSRLESNLDNIDAAIVASPDEYHKEYAKWSLEHGLHVLVDKPLTIPTDSDFVTNPERSKNFMKDFDELCALAKGKLFMLGTHRRYQQISQRTGDLIKNFRMEGGHRYLHNIHVLTADGYWIVPEFLHQAYSTEMGSSGYYGGKLTHTGYHLLDLVPWLMRHAEPKIDRAEVYVVPYTPRDSAFLAGVEGLYTPYPDINANMLVGFSYQGKVVSAFSFSAVHEGFSRRTTFRGVDREGRTKLEEIAICQGPKTGYIIRRFAKFLDEREGCGGLDHQTLDIFGEDPPLKTEHIGYDDGNVGPSTDFFRALKNGDYSKVISPVSDQIIGIKLLSAAYEHMIRRINGDISPVIVDFAEKEWQMPPGRV